MEEKKKKAEWWPWEAVLHVESLSPAEVPASKALNP